MHDKFKVNDIKFSNDEKKFRIACMQEELNEYIEANTNADELDALVDLLIFTLGTIDRHGWSNLLQIAFDRVMTSNMTKVLGKNKKRGNFKLDLIKPEGFKHADLNDLF
jgi:hypothetical protein